MLFINTDVIDHHTLISFEKKKFGLFFIGEKCLEVHKAKAYSIALGVSAPNWYGKRFSPKLYEERVGRINLRMTRRHL
jgi:hypothetical protein